MPTWFSLLHAPAFRPGWRALLGFLMVLVCVLAFVPQPPTLDVVDGDKLQHIVAFACLAGCAALSTGPGWRSAAGITLAMLCFGIFIELVQSRIPSRSAEWQDVVADTVGILTGLLLMAAARRWHRPATPR